MEPTIDQRAFGRLEHSVETIDRSVQALTHALHEFREQVTHRIDSLSVRIGHIEEKWRTGKAIAVVAVIVAVFAGFGFRAAVDLLTKVLLP